MDLIYSNIYQSTVNIINKILHSTLAICVKFKHFLQKNHSNVCTWKWLSCVRFFATSRTTQSMEFSRPEYWSGSCFLLQGIFPTQGSNPSLPHCRQILYQLSHQRSLRKLNWVAYPFSRGSSWPMNWTGVSSIAGGFFTSWDTREAPKQVWKSLQFILTPIV